MHQENNASKSQNNASRKQNNASRKQCIKITYQRKTSATPTKFYFALEEISTTLIRCFASQNSCKFLFGILVLVEKRARGSLFLDLNLYQRSEKRKKGKEEEFLGV
eukprot:GHVP01023196.1.p4 GENE.GHVP01023196.1~~GHVP01023196.1.p4  ORF type:complete len:106 (+),score=18.78 GHVP01023196.1:862-1179(+)